MLGTKEGTLLGLPNGSVLSTELGKMLGSSRGTKLGSMLGPQPGLTKGQKLGSVTGSLSGPTKGQKFGTLGSLISTKLVGSMLGPKQGSTEGTNEDASKQAPRESLEHKKQVWKSIKQQFIENFKTTSTSAPLTLHLLHPLTWIQTATHSSISAQSK